MDFGFLNDSTNKWGKNQRNYYGTSYVDKDFGGVNDSEEEEMLQLEEEDAISRQKKIDTGNSLVDFDGLIANSTIKNKGRSKLFEVLHISVAKETPEKETAQGKSRDNIGTTFEQNVCDLQSETSTDGGNFDDGGPCVSKEMRRKINYEIRKNKGIRKDKGRRKAKQRHSRVMKRTQYEKALIKRKSQVPNMRREMERYDGEKRGIRISTIRSTKF
ncbi:hypothetical protein niasHT_005174 [Heterodera trifolii]|uniref:Sas10 C-terminal domain-containing protein n=1 Tax=Heterodera trifolii TaxID=157864 RepID=A0ABD2LRS3_9BILA